MVLNKNLQVRPFLPPAKRHGLTRLQEINIQNMNVELVAQMFKNYQSNVLFHLEATDSLKEPVEQ
ncbi:DASH complex subunit dad4 [Diplodia seriata]|uniref:DASH complex subunit DAD4 n=1 Tax=Diplodia seriata TaxID=420778 RepID=A0ABR3CTF9_9PEZI